MSHEEADHPAFSPLQSTEALVGLRRRFLSLKTLLFAIFCLGFALSVVVALSQDAPTQASKAPTDIGARPTTIMGTVQEDCEKLRFVTEERAWKVDNPMSDFVFARCQLGVLVSAGAAT
jgi:hypothetical protein